MPGHLLLSLLSFSFVVASHSAICRLRLTGHSQGADASVECDGRINLSFSPDVRIAKSRVSGSVTINSKTCLVEGCLVSICNTSAVFRSSQVSKVQLKGSLGEKNGIICVLGRSNVEFEGLIVNSSYGSGILARDSARVLVKNSSFSGGRAAGGAGILVLGNADVIIQNSVLYGNTVDGYYGGGGLATAENSTVRLEHSVVTRNTALKAFAGGGIAVVDAASLVASHSTISYNQAEGGGAGIAAFYNSTLLITNGSSVIENIGTGTYGGGGLAINDQTVATITGRSIIQGNSVLHNSGGGFMVDGLNATLICTGNSILADNSASLGGAAFIGNGARFIMGDTTSKCTFVNNSSPTGLNIQASRNSQLLFNNTNIDMSSSTVVWNRNVCFLGETVRVSCQLCRSGTYSLNPKNESCDFCPAPGANCTGGAALIPTAGWWHSSQNSTQFHSCPHMQAVCLYGGDCAQGYGGNLCGSCAAGYASNAPFHCTLCGSSTRVWAVYILVSLLSVALVAVTAHASWRDNQSGSNDLRSSHMLHVVIMLGQYLLLISSIPLDWPQTLETVFRAFGAVFGAFGGQLASLDCILQDFGHVTAIPVAIMRQLATLLAPPAVFVAVVLLNLMWWGCKAVLHQLLSCTARATFVARVTRALGLQTRPNLVAQLPITALVVLSVSYPFLVRMSLGFFACIPLDNAKSAVDPYPQYAMANATHGYWVSDMQQACWLGYHMKWALFMGIPCVAVFCVGMPLAIVLWLSAHTEASESDPKFREKYGILYRNLKPSRFWFEAVLRLFMSVVCAISAFRYTLGSYYATLLMNGVFGAYCALQVVLKPYHSSTLSTMQLLAFLCLYFVTYIGLTLFSVDTDAGLQYQQAAGIVALICVIAYILWCIILIVKHSQQLILQVLECLLPCLKKPKARLPRNLVESLPTIKDVERK